MRYLWAASSRSSRRRTVTARARCGGEPSGRKREQATARAGGLSFTFPPIAKGAMDGAPDRFGLVGEEQTTATARAGGLSFTFPPIAKGAMDGAPVGGGGLKGEQATTSATAGPSTPLFARARTASLRMTIFGSVGGGCVQRGDIGFRGGDLVAGLGPVGD
jgi:hypothetical protein